MLKRGEPALWLSHRKTSFVWSPQKRGIKHSPCNFLYILHIHVLRKKEHFVYYSSNVLVCLSCVYTSRKPVLIITKRGVSLSLYLHTRWIGITNLKYFPSQYKEIDLSSFSMTILSQSLQDKIFNGLNNF